MTTTARTIVIRGFIFSLHSDRGVDDLCFVCNTPVSVYILRPLADGETKALANGLKMTRVANPKPVFDTRLLFTFILCLSGSMVGFGFDLKMTLAADEKRAG